MDKGSRRILTTAFKRFQESDFACAPSVKWVCGSGYLGIVKCHANSQTPRKASKHKPLTAEDKAYNRSLAKERILNEQVIRYLKRFRSLGERYRNRRRRFGLRFNLIAAIYNLQHAKP